MMPVKVKKQPSSPRRPFKIPSESAVTSYFWAMPQHANPSGIHPSSKDNINGGVILNWIDNTAGMVAARHAQSRVVTASIDQVSFIRPIKVGDLIKIKASVNRVFTTSMEVGVRVEAEKVGEGISIHSVSSYLTFVALDDEGKPTPIKFDLKPTNDTEKRRWAEAGERRKARLQLRRQLERRRENT